jgi:hypothetical protein
LIKENAEIDHSSFEGLTALILASMVGHFEVIQFLLDHDADRDSKSIEGKTALDYARDQGHTEIVDLLLHYPETTA